MSLRLSSETVHASTVGMGGRAVLITGNSGSGKSDLALRLIDRGFTLVADDQTIVQKRGERLHVSAPPTIRGKLEIRGLGILPMPVVEDLPLALVVELTGDIRRLPDDARERVFCGLSVPLISVDALTASAAAKVVLALDRFGLK